MSSVTECEDDVLCTESLLVKMRCPESLLVKMRCPESLHVRMRCLESLNVKMRLCCPECLNTKISNVPSCWNRPFHLFHRLH